MLGSYSRIDYILLLHAQPELLYGQKDYTVAVDMWSVGCIFGEFLQHSPLLPGTTELQQLTLISQLIGPPTPQIWPALTALPHYRTFAPHASAVSQKMTPLDMLRCKFAKSTTNTVELLAAMLSYDPDQRITVQEALKHRYFPEMPYMSMRGCARTLGGGTHADTYFRHYSSLHRGQDSFANVPRVPKQGLRAEDGQGTAAEQATPRTIIVLAQAIAPSFFVIIVQAYTTRQSYFLIETSRQLKVGPLPCDNKRQRSHRPHESCPYPQSWRETQRPYTNVRTHQEKVHAERVHVAEA